MFYLSFAYQKSPLVVQGTNKTLLTATSLSLAELFNKMLDVVPRHLLRVVLV